MKEIKLSIQGKNKGKFIVLVDNEDFAWLNQWKWNVIKGLNNYYASRNSRKNGIKELIYMHRLIMNTPKNMEVDHKDHNGLNNQKSNLRNCTQSQNQKNKRASGKSKYLGVTHYKHRNKYDYIASQISMNGKIVRLGYFKTEKEAAIAYNEATLKYHGEFANFNKI
jgi:hypothetical protein